MSAPKLQIPENFRALITSDVLRTGTVRGPVLRRGPLDILCGDWNVGLIMKLDEIVAEASKLSEEERASLASQLLHGLQSPVYEVSDDEVRKRIEEADADPSVLISLDELVAGLRRGGA